MGIERIVCYLQFLKTGVWTPASIEVEFDNGSINEYDATDEDGHEIHISQDDVSFSHDPRTEEDFLLVSDSAESQIKEIILFQTKWRRLPYAKIVYKQLLSGSILI